MEYKLNLGCWGNVFAVPAAVVDDYIKIASGDNLRILLFFLRNADKAYTLGQIGQCLSLTENQVEDGLAFWKQRGLLAECSGEIKPADGEAKMQTVSEPTFKQEQSSLQRIELTKAPAFTPKEIAKTVRGNEKADLLFKYCEKMFGRALKHNEQNTLMIIIEDACMPVEVAMLMIEYCFSIEKKSPAYMRSLALDWTEREINTIEKAEAHIMELKNLNSAQSRLRTMFGMNSAFSRAQKDYIETWVNKFCFTDEMIDAAYQRTLDNTGKLSFSYMNKILASWHNMGYTRLEQVEKDKKDKASDTGSSFDISEIEKMVAEKYKG